MAADERTALHPLQPRLHAVPVVEHDLVLAGLHLRHVDRDFACGDAVFGSPTGKVGGMRAGHQRLGRDTAGVDASPADQFALDHRHGVSGFCQPARHGRAALACADDDRVELLCHEKTVQTRLTRKATRNPPPTAMTSSRNAPGRSFPSLAAVRRCRTAAPPSVPSTAPTIPAPVAVKVWKKALPMTAPAKAPMISRVRNCGAVLRLGVLGN